MMRLERLSLQNWRCFAAINLPLGSFSLLVGPCGSGKTSLLDALCFLKDLASGISLREAVARRGGFSRLRNLEARFPATDVLLEVQVKGKEERAWVYRLKFGEENGRLTVKEEMVWQSFSLTVRRPDLADQKNPKRRAESVLYPLMATPPIERLANFLRSFRLENPFPQLWRQPVLTTQLGPEASCLGLDFWKRVAQTPERIRHVRLLHISRALQSIIPAVGGLRVEMDRLGHWHLWVAFRQWRPRATWMVERQLPDGLRRLIQLLWSVMEGAAPLFIEEPEIGFHPEAAAKFPRIFKELGRLSHRPPQLILTTHQPALIQDRLVRKEEVSLLVPDKRGTKVARGAPKELVVGFLEAGAAMAEKIKPWLVSPEEPWLPLLVEGSRQKRPSPRN